MSLIKPEPGYHIAPPSLDVKPTETLPGEYAFVCPQCPRKFKTKGKIFFRFVVYMHGLLTFPPFLQVHWTHTTFFTWTRNNIVAVTAPNVMSSKRTSNITLSRHMRIRSRLFVPYAKRVSHNPVTFKRTLPYTRPSGRSLAPTANNHSRNSAISSHTAKTNTTDISIWPVAFVYAPTKQQNSWSTILNTRVAVWIHIRVICAMEGSFVMRPTWICICRRCIRVPRNWTPISDDEKLPTTPRRYELRVRISKVYY